jgi:hypothetical protein
MKFDQFSINTQLNTTATAATDTVSNRMTMRKDGAFNRLAKVFRARCPSRSLAQATPDSSTERRSFGSSSGRFSWNMTCIRIGAAPGVTDRAWRDYRSLRSRCRMNALRQPSDGLRDRADRCRLEAADRDSGIVSCVPRAGALPIMISQSLPPNSIKTHHSREMSLHFLSFLPEFGIPTRNYPS